ncbi:MAG TPA: lytic transglycosylase domain-containing protein [Candidatus Kapabacteria bacterium]|nr:lytic transglycosylase domain-containing protein [Candidatus Kapabacteria bacterium]
MNIIPTAHPRLALVVGLVTGIVVVGTLAPSPSPDAPPLDKSYRPNISLLKLPQKLDFCGEAIPMDDPDVRKRMEREFLLSLQSDGQMMLYLKRSGEYFAMFDSLLAAENAPADLKYLAVAESALYMTQSGKGAVGLWQFIPETARRYGLRVDDFVDERRHPVRSTMAAIRYLKDNRSRFGNWGLAVAAYNMGENATQDDMTFQKQNSYFNLFLNEETARYLFRIVAIKEIMQHAEHYGYSLAKDEYYQAIPSRSVQVTTEIPNLEAWAESQGTSYKMVKLLNPWILKRTLPKPAQDAPYRIAVPLSEAK